MSPAMMPGIDPKYAAIGYQQSMGYGISTMGPDMYSKMNPGYGYPGAISPGYHPIMYSNYSMSMGGAPSPPAGARAYVAATMTSPNGTPVMTDSNANTYRATSDYMNGKSYYNVNSQYSPVPAAAASQPQQQARYPSPDENRHVGHQINAEGMMTKPVNESSTPPTYSSDNTTGRHWPQTTQHSDLSRPVAYVPVLL